MSQYAVYQALENLRSVLILLIPVGSISNEKFLKYAQHVASCTSLPLQDFQGFGATTSGGFENRNWNRDVIHLRYETYHVQSEWEELFLYQKPFAVVGIADCSVEMDLSATCNKFTVLTNRYRISPSTSIMQHGNVPKTCLAFELRSDQRDPDQSNFKVIPDQDFEHFNFYITHIFGEELVKGWLSLWESTVRSDPEAIADKIFDSLYGPSENVSNPSTSHTALITPLDRDLPDEAPKGRKRRLLGRVKKQVGDLCLFAGSPVDAMMHYRQALEICRSCSDWEWVGSTLESMASAVLSVRDMTGNDRMSQLEIHEITSRLVEAHTWYNRRPHAVYLESENLLRSAHFFLAQDKRLEMSERLSKCADLVDGMDPSQLQSRIRLYSAIALVYRNANFARKYAFFIQLICRLCVASDIPPSRSHQLLEQVAPEYDITANSLIDTSQEAAKMKSAPKTRRERLIQSGASWTKLQASILALLIDLSASSGDTTQSIKYLVYMMREVSPKILASDFSISPSFASSSSSSSTTSGSSISSASNSPLPKVDWGLKLKQFATHLPPPLDTAEGDPLRLGLGILKKWKAQKDSSLYMHISRSVTDPLFLYRPNRKAKEAIAASANHVFCWPGHSIYFEVKLANPLFQQKAILEDVRIVFSPIVLTTTEARPGDIRVDIDWLPPIEVQPTPATSAQIVVEPSESVTIKLSTSIPFIRSKIDSSTGLPVPNGLEDILKDPRCKILLLPEKFTYTMFNCPFSEPMALKFNTSPKVLLAECLHYIHDVPTVTIEDSAHPWISYTAVARDAEPILIVPATKNASSEIKPSSLDQTAELATSSGNLKSSATPSSGKSVHNLTIAISQLKGEMFKTQLVLTNDSPHTVDDFGITIQENGETISQHRPNQVIVGDLSYIYDVISKALPLRSGETIQIPLEFVSPYLGLVQVSFLMEYRNNGSAENIWRKLRMDYSFKVVESIKTLDLDVLTAVDSTVEVIDQATPQTMVVLNDQTPSNLESGAGQAIESCEYFMLQLALHNKTMLSFHVMKDDQPTAAWYAHAKASVLDPWATKRFLLAIHRQTFVNLMRFKARQLITSGVVKGENLNVVAYRHACKQFLESHLKLSWKSYGNRSGIVHLDSNLITDSLLDQLMPQRFEASLGIETSQGEAIFRKANIDTPGVASYSLQANQIYYITADITHLNLPIAQSMDSLLILDDAKGNTVSSSSDDSDLPTTPRKALTCGASFSAFCKSHHLNSVQRTMSWIGKNQNVSIPDLLGPLQPSKIRIPLLFHSPGTYTINGSVSDPSDPNGTYWTKDASIVVTR
jgi:hypothetical protein